MVVRRTANVKFHKWCCNSFLDYFYTFCIEEDKKEKEEEEHKDVVASSFIPSPLNPTHRAHSEEFYLLVCAISTRGIQTFFSILLQWQTTATNIEWMKKQNERNHARNSFDIYLAPHMRLSSHKSQWMCAKWYCTGIVERQEQYS